MRSALARAVFTLFLTGTAGIAVVTAESRLEKILFVEAPPRLVSQCALREVTAKQITCLHNGRPLTVLLASNITVWKGQDRRDTSALRPGDRLDIRLGIDSHNREVATFVWANLAKVEGVVGRAVAGHVGWVAVHPLIPGAIGEVSDQPLYAYVNGTTVFLAGAQRQDLRRGRPVIVIGERLDDRRIIANRILLARP